MRISSTCKRASSSCPRMVSPPGSTSAGWRASAKTTSPGASPESSPSVIDASPQRSEASMRSAAASGASVPRARGAGAIEDEPRDEAVDERARRAVERDEGEELEQGPLRGERAEAVRRGIPGATEVGEHRRAERGVELERRRRGGGLEREREAHR